ncbi:MAG: hypothetical protein WDO24_24005 [Pseudomonadota bacterium]
MIRRLHAAGETFLIVEHNVDFIMNLCDRVIVFDQGRKLMEGSPEAVHRDPRVWRLILAPRPESERPEPEPVLALDGVSAGYADRRDRARLLLPAGAGQHHDLDRRQRRRQIDLMRAIFGTCQWLGGGIRFKGEAIERLPPWDRLARGIGLVPQGAAISPRCRCWRIW